ncbi:MAG TPA: DUF4339 domain-containing protein [Planctomicrobium sp.]|nr:DUF4339 domain-containing protein [Planctomicrobium sp.]
MPFFKGDWYCFTDDESGPHPFQQVVRMYADGELQPGDLVRKKEESDWQAIESVPELQSAMQRFRQRKHKRRCFCLKMRDVFLGKNRRP